jgi:hypothetical protein
LETVVWSKFPGVASPFSGWRNLLVEGLGVGGGGRDVGVTGSLVGAGGELDLVGGLEVGVAGLAVGTGVVEKQVCLL